MSTSGESEGSPSTLAEPGGALDAPKGSLSLLEQHRQCWRDGERLSVEAFLEKIPRPDLDDDMLLDLIYNEVLLREEHGDSPDLDDYLRRFPQFAGELRSQFDVHRALESGRAFTLNLFSASFVLENQPPIAPAGAHAIGHESTSHAPIAEGPPRHASIAGASLRFETGRPTLEGYDIQDVLGSGGMGTVFRAFDRVRRRAVALKVMNRAGAAAILRFKHEFRTLLGIAHPNLVTLHELISDGQNWFLTMELLDGVSFLQYVRGDEPHASTGTTGTDAQPLTAAGAVRLRAVIRQLAEGIAWLHGAGKLHRDVKPTNVMVTREGRVVLLDFGLIAEQGRDGRHHSTEEHILGTAAYMAPEQAAGAAVSPATDWYSVGVMLYEAITGRLPFTGTPVAVLMVKQRFEPPPPVGLAPEVPEDLSALCVDLLRRRPADRPAASEVLRRLGSSEPAQNASPSPDLAPVSLSSAAHGQRPSLVGRRRHREALDEALTAMSGGHTVVVYLHGHSGAGKTALVRSFLDTRIERGDAVVLAGRCYERESVPYKALDSLIDALGWHLKHLPEAELAALLPRDIASLARVFPGLRQVAARRMRRAGSSRARIPRSCAAARSRRCVSYSPGWATGRRSSWPSTTSSGAMSTAPR